MSAPRWMIERVKRDIDPALTVEWLNREGCYAIVQEDDEHMESLDELADSVGRKLWMDEIKDGHATEVDLATCVRVAYGFVGSSRIVRRLRDRKTGQPITLDERTITELRRAAWIRRNWGVRERIQAEDDMMYEDKRARENYLHRERMLRKADPIFRRHMSDLAHGLRPIRSVHGRPEAAKEAP